jgi:hypothetical protein
MHGKRTACQRKTEGHQWRKPDSAAHSQTPTSPHACRTQGSRSWTPPTTARHAVAALNGITGAHVDWADSKGLNAWERKALELREERRQRLQVAQPHATPFSGSCHLDARRASAVPARSETAPRPNFQAGDEARMACPRDAPGRPSTANSRHPEQPTNMPGNAGFRLPSNAWGHTCQVHPPKVGTKTAKSPRAALASYTAPTRRRGAPAAGGCTPVRPEFRRSRTVETAD